MKFSTQQPLLLATILPLIAAAQPAAQPTLAPRAGDLTRMKLAKRDETSMPSQSSGVPALELGPMARCKGLGVPFKAYDQGGRGLQLLDKIEPVKCRDRNECEAVFLDFSDNLGPPTWATAITNCVDGTCKVTCRPGWTETSGHCSITADNIVFNDYCCGGSIAGEKGCFCKAGQKVDGEGKCVD